MISISIMFQVDLLLVNSILSNCCIYRWLAFQACPFRGHDESPGSKNRGNFIEMLKILASYNKEVNEVVLENAPRNAKHLRRSPEIICKHNCS